MARGYDPQLIRERLRRGSIDDSTPRITESKIRDAQSHIERSRSQSSSNKIQPLTEGLLRQAELEKELKQRKLNRSSKDGSTIGGARRPSDASESHVESLYDAEGFKMKINPRQPYEFDLGNQRVAIRPNEDGGMDFVYVGGKRETPYYSTNGSASTSSKIGRRASQRTSRVYDDEEDEEEYFRERPSRRDRGRGRAETLGTYESSRHNPRRPSREDGYRGPSKHSATPEDYARPPLRNRYSQGSSGHNIGTNKHFPGFGA
jgi:hypothetical protein